MSTSLRMLLRLAFVLAVIVVGASVTLRLSANGLGCSPWPACYGQTATAAAVNDDALTRALRLAHRIAASGFALLAVALVIVGWRRWPPPSRAAGLALLAVTVSLSVLGVLTPSPLPFVTLGNVLGGFALLGLLAYLLASTGRNGRRCASTGAIALLLVLAIQVAGGAMISARLAGDACVAGCREVWLPGASALARPLAAGSATELVHPALGGQPLQLLHRFGGLMLAIVVSLSAFAWRARRGWRRLAIAVAATAGLGFTIAVAEPSLGLAVMHALAAALLVAASAALLARPPMEGQEESA